MAKKAKQEQVLVNVVDEMILRAVRQRQEWKMLIEQAEAELARQEEIIKQFMADSGHTAIAVGDHKVTVSTFVRETVSKDAVKEAVSAELFEKLVKRTPTTRLTIK